MLHWLPFEKCMWCWWWHYNCHVHHRWAVWLRGIIFQYRPCFISSLLVNRIALPLQHCFLKHHGTLFLLYYAVCKCFGRIGFLTGDVWGGRTLQLLELGWVLRIQIDGGDFVVCREMLGSDPLTMCGRARSLLYYLTEETWRGILEH